MYLLQTTPGWFSGIEALDRRLFFVINSRWSNNFLDGVLPFLRESSIWLPLYLFLLVFVTLNFGKRGWLLALFAVCNGALTDLVSSRLIKEHIMRLRPCRDPDLAQLRFLVNYCPQSSSFTSSHAANHFSAAVFLVMTLQPYTSKWIRLLFLWAAVISYAQVYVGVHYPLDVVCGGLIGSLVGYLVARLFNAYVGLQQTVRLYN